MYETKKASAQNAWADQSFRVLGSSWSAQGFFDWLQIAVYSDLPVFYNFNLEAIQSTCIFFCLFLNPTRSWKDDCIEMYINDDRPHHMLWKWCCLWLLPSEAKCCVISPFAPTKWYQPCPVGQFTGPAGILHIALPPNPAFLPKEAQAHQDDVLTFLTLMCCNHRPGWASSAQVL